VTGIVKASKARYEHYWVIVHTKSILARLACMHKAPCRNAIPVVATCMTIKQDVR
jgi:hypothetical protein